MVILFGLCLCNIGGSLYNKNGVTMTLNIRKDAKFGGKLEIAKGILHPKIFEREPNFPIWIFPHHFILLTSIVIFDSPL